MSEQTEKAAETIQKNSLSSGKRSRHRLKVVVGGILLALLVLLIGALVLRDLLIEQAICRIGTMVAGTAVTIDDFDSHPLRGEIILNDLRIANPAGYYNQDAIRIPYLRVRLNPGTLLKEKIVIQEIFIRGLSVNFEIQTDGSSNLTDIQKNVDTFANAEQTQGEQQETPTETGASKQLVIRLLRAEDGELSTSSSFLTSTLCIPLPPLELTNIGDGKPWSDTLSDLFTELLVAIGKGLSSAGLSAENLKAFGNTLQRGGVAVFNSVTESGKTVANGVAEGGKAVVDGVAEGGKKLVNSVNELFHNTAK